MLKNGVYAAEASLKTGSNILLTNDDELDPYIDRAMESFQTDPNSTSKHMNWCLINNCKSESSKLFEQALYDYKKKYRKSLFWSYKIWEEI
jgi:hypothetical protein